MMHRALMIGAGGMAGRWARAFVPLHADRVGIVGLVDVNESVLNATADEIGVAEERRFTAMEAAFAARRRPRTRRSTWRRWSTRSLDEQPSRRYAQQHDVVDPGARRARPRLRYGDQCAHAPAVLTR
jgi:hypothetical protein